MCLNVHGSLGMKLECDEFVESVRQYDIVLLCETWTNEENEPVLNGYVCFGKYRRRKKRAKRDSGGLVCFVRESVSKGVTIENWDYEDGMCMKLDKECFGWVEDLFLLLVYMRASSSTREDVNTSGNCYDNVIDQIARVSDRGGVIVAGDMNARIGEREECTIVRELDEYEEEMFPMMSQTRDGSKIFSEIDFISNNMTVSRKNQDKKIKAYGHQLLNLCKTCDLAVLNGRTDKDRNIGATTFCNKNGKSTIDFVLCDKIALRKVNRFEIHEANCFSDHSIVSFSLRVRFRNNRDAAEDVRRSRTYPKWREEKKEVYLTRITCDEVQEKIRALTVELRDNCVPSQIEYFVEELTKIFTDSGSSHVTRNSQSPRGRKNEGKQRNGTWFDEECLYQRNMFCEKRRRYLEIDSEENRASMCRERSKYRSMCRRKKRGFNQREAKRLVDLSKKDPRAFWREVGSKKKGKVGGGAKCDFFSHFKQLAQRESAVGDEGREEIQYWEIAEEEHYIECLDSPIDIEELNNAIKNLKNGKAAGPDDILNEFITNTTLDGKLCILALFNSVLSLEYFPSCWAVGSIVPIHKSGDENIANNYRGITLLSCLGKLFTRILNDRLNMWAEESGVLSEAQFGFRKGRGTADCLFTLHGLIEILLGQGKKLFCAFIDYEKAYDYLDRAAVWAKLMKAGVSSKCIRIFKDMYSKMKLRVRGEELNGDFYSNLGLLQGESTSPILFSLFVNDMERTMTDQSVGISIQGILIKILMFADDMAILSETKEGLQRGLESLENYCRKWGIKVNAAKTKVIVFKKGGGTVGTDLWYFKGKTLETVSAFKYLGYWVSKSGSFALGTQEIVNSARRALFVLKKQFAKNPEMPPSMQLYLFRSVVLPILTYGCEVWGLCKADPIERFHLSFLKSVLNVKTSTPTCFVYGELGIFPLIIERKIRVIKYWLKIIRREREELDNVFARKIYEELMHLSEMKPNVVTWVTLVKDLLNKCGMGNYWFEQFVGDERYFIAVFKERLQDIFLQEWYGELSQTSDLRLYKHIKISFKYESYLNECSRALRVAATKVRLSSHTFCIETGRWAREKQDPAERKCTLCNIIEDEYHCLVECPRFAKERKKYLPERLKRRRSMFEFIKFCKSESEADRKNFSLLCYSVLKEHQKYL